MRFVGWAVRAAIMAVVLGVSLGATALASAATCGPSWNEVSASGPSFGLYTLSALSANDAWSAGPVAWSAPPFAYGVPGLTHWDGTSWSAVSSLPPGPTGNGILTQMSFADVSALSANNVWAVGHTHTSSLNGDSDSPLIAHWDGANWSTFKPPTASRFAEAVAISAASPSDLWVLVNDGYAIGRGNMFFEHWNGTSWSVVPSAPPTSANNGASILEAVSALSPNDAWAVGSSHNYLGGTSSTLIEHWNGTSWTVAPSPNAATFDELKVVKAIAANDVWAAGESRGQPLFEHWDGTSWTVVPSPLLDVTVSLVKSIAAVSPGDVWAVGWTVLGNTDRMFLEHWDGTTWSVIKSKSTTQHKGLEGLSAFPDGTVLAVGWASSPPGHSLTTELCELRVFDAGFSAKRSSGIGFGTTVAWNIDSADALAHSVTDGTGMGLFDSGPRPPGDSFTYEFPAAGSYRLIDGASGHTSTVSVGMTAKPTSGTAATAFTLTWATGSATSGFVSDVQVSRPGPTLYADLLTGTSNPSTTFTPDAGVGTYAFRARIRNTGNGASSGWSSARTITVG
jgi:hypothetical protein